MRVTYRWLKEFLPDLSASAEEVAAALTSAGLEVESVESLAAGFEKVVVGRLLEVRRHPNADRLTVCDVTLSPDARSVRQIVCGANNHKAGDKVAVALPGATLPNGTAIQKGKIRGEVSDGMLCSETELRLRESSAGIWILPPDTVEGRPVAEAMNLADWAFEVAVTPNRGDCLSVIGLAREAGAALEVPFRVPRVDVPVAPAAASSAVKLFVDDPAGCPRYVARVIEGVTIGPSPAWMVRRLEACGVRAINAVVDVTNYVMLETGQPLHAFDAERIRGGEIVVRAARPGESMKTLDGVERALVADDLVIADGAGAVAIAGVMGGEGSGVRETTTTIVLEAAHFDPARVRRTARRLGLHTDASHRFERDVDPSGVDRASSDAARRIAELTGGRVLAGSVERSAGAFEPREVALTAARVRSLLGIEIEEREIVDLLAPLQLHARPDGPGRLAVTVPRFRADLKIEADLVEEVARRRGYERIPERRPLARMTAEGHSSDLERVRAARALLVGLGFSEAIHLPFAPEDEAARFKLPPEDPRAQTVPLANPLAADQAVLRATLVPGLLRALARNRALRTFDVRLFELRPAFRWQGAGRLPDETRRLSAILSGRRHPPHWGQPSLDVDLFDAKAVAETAVAALTRRAAAFVPSTEPFLIAGAQAHVDVAGRTVGFVGELDPEVLAAFGLPAGTGAIARAFAVELDFDALVALGCPTPTYEELPRHPSVERDLALLVDDGVSAGSLLSAIRAYQKKGLEAVEVVDLYRGDRLPAGKKSLALRMTWRAADRTLTDDEVNALHEKVVVQLVSTFKAERR